MKLIKTEDAVGHILCQDITQIIKDKKKGPVFRKGHVVGEADIPVLLSVGKEHLYIWECDENHLHENEAAEILYEVCAGDYMEPSEIKEGKIEVIATKRGVLKIDKEKLLSINSLEEVMIATRHNHTVVEAGDKLAGTRVIPLIVSWEKMRQVKCIGSKKPLLEIKPFLYKKVGIVTTGNEILKGRIADTFTPVILEKFQGYEHEIVGQKMPGDEKHLITKSILELVEEGADLVVCTGGMSVDPDDRTPGGISGTNARVVTYGAPVLPGAMMMIAYLEKNNKRIPILGLPGCVMYARKTIFDLLLPRIMADDEIEKQEIAALGLGGLCLLCDTCTYPNCGFGKGE